MGVLNVDVIGYHHRVNRFISETMLCQSANHSTYKTADLIRLKAALIAMRFYLDYTNKVPEQDLPETNPRTYALRPDPEVKEVENEMVNHVVQLLMLCRDEMNNSQSASYASGISPHDLKRAHDYITRIEQFLSEYVDKATPLDLPESSPRAPIQGSGKTGTHAS